MSSTIRNKKHRKVEVFRLPPQLSEKLAKESQRRGMTKTKIVEWALRDYLAIKPE